MSFADEAFNACAAKAKELGRRLNEAEWKQAVQSVYDQYQADTTQAATRIDKRSQTELFNALCMACGINPLECPSGMKKTISVALADIRSVTPNLTPDEIARRARAYKSKHRDWPLTAMSLAKWWGEFGQDPAKTFAARSSMEPDGWKEVVPDLMPDADPASISYIVNQMGWSRMSSDMQTAIKKRLHAD